MQELWEGTIDHCPLPVMTKDGQRIPVESRVTKGEWDGRPVLFVVCKDISEIRPRKRNFVAASVPAQKKNDLLFGCEHSVHAVSNKVLDS